MLKVLKPVTGLKLGQVEQVGQVFVLVMEAMGLRPVGRLEMQPISGTGLGPVEEVVVVTGLVVLELQGLVGLQGRAGLDQPEPEV